MNRLWLIVRWPAKMSDKVKPGTVSSEIISSLDFLPTFCELAGTKPPGDLKLDGTNFLPLFEGEKVARPKPLFWCYFDALNEHRMAMRAGEWKLLAKLNGGELPKFSNVFDGNVDQIRAAKLTDFELYRLPVDPSESVKVTRRHPKEFGKLKERMEDIYRELVSESRVWSTR